MLCRGYISTIKSPCQNPNAMKINHRCKRMEHHQDCGNEIGAGHEGFSLGPWCVVPADIPQLTKRANPPSPCGSVPGTTHRHSQPFPALRPGWEEVGRFASRGYDAPVQPRTMLARHAPESRAETKTHIQPRESDPGVSMPRRHSHPSHSTCGRVYR